MSVSVGQILELLNGIAPFEGAEAWDNVGLLAGSRATKVDCVLCALDLNQRVLDEAIRKGAQMIVTHHPILFRARRSLCTDDAEGRLLCNLVGSGIALVAMHTNYDNTHPGVNDALAAKLGFRDVVAGENGMCAGTIETTTLAALKKRVEETLGGSVRSYGDPRRRIQRVAVLGGAGEDFVPQALAMGADAYITGEMSYHKGLSAVDEGLCVLEAGHAATEIPGIFALAGGLQNAANVVQYKIRVLCSEEGLFL